MPHKPPQWLPDRRRQTFCQPCHSRKRLSLLTGSQVSKLSANIQTAQHVKCQIILTLKNGFLSGQYRHHLILSAAKFCIEPSYFPESEQAANQANQDPPIPVLRRSPIRVFCHLCSVCQTGSVLIALLLPVSARYRTRQPPLPGKSGAETYALRHRLEARLFAKHGHRNPQR